VSAEKIPVPISDDEGEEDIEYEVIEDDDDEAGSQDVVGYVFAVVDQQPASVAAVSGSCKPMVDSGSVVSTCPSWYAPGVETVQTDYSLNLESVLGEKLKHYGFKHGVNYKNKSGESLEAGYEVTDSTRPILSVKKSSEAGQMTVFGPSRSRIIKDPESIKAIESIIEKAQGVDIILENGAYVADVELSTAEPPAQAGPVAPQVHSAPTVTRTNLERVVKDAFRGGAGGRDVP
jgi:hypothetical protein